MSTLCMRLPARSRRGHSRISWVDFEIDFLRRKRLILGIPRCVSRLTVLKRGRGSCCAIPLRWCIFVPNPRKSTARKPVRRFGRFTSKWRCQCGCRMPAKCTRSARPRIIRLPTVPRWALQIQQDFPGVISYKPVWRQLRIGRPIRELLLVSNRDVSLDSSVQNDFSPIQSCSHRLRSLWTSRTGHRAVLFPAIGVLPAFFQKNSSSVQGLSSPFDRNLAPDREGNNAPRRGGEKC